ncbi:MAG: M23 family metallopeptidase [Anaerolineales bacterium]|nr:M23 family metallopeptidase [Anaerolineales bacterium]
MDHIRSTGGGASPLSLVSWATVVAVLAGAAYLFGAGLAQRWLGAAPAVAPNATLMPVVEAAPLAQRLIPGEPVEGVLGEQDAHLWEFDGLVGQSVTVEMWLHPGSGSNLEAELVVQLFAPDGSLLNEETGTLFLPPYVVQPSLQTGGAYRLRVAPETGAPGRYSLLVTVSEPAERVVVASTAQPRLTATPPNNGPAEAAPPGLFIWPTPQRRISGWIFHDPGNPGHIGLDIAAAMWDPIASIADGVVVFAEWGGGYGNLVIVDHPEGWRTYYAHLSEFAVEVGQEVRQGELLGGAGTTGYSTGTHLHFELRYRGRPVDPQMYLP